MYQVFGSYLLLGDHTDHMHQSDPPGLLRWPDPAHGNSIRSHSWPDCGMSGILQSTEWSQPCLVDTSCASPWRPHSISTALNMEMQPNRVEWKGLTDTQCQVCDWLLKGNMVHHIHQNHTEWPSSPSWREIVLWGYPGVPTRMVLATGVSYKLHQDVWPVPWPVWI